MREIATAQQVALFIGSILFGIKFGWVIGSGAYFMGWAVMPAYKV